MEDNHFEKRMALLKKSYERVPSSFNSEEVLQKIGEESKEKTSEGFLPKKRPKFKQNAIAWAVGIASLFLIGVLSATYFLPESQEHADGEQEEVSEAFLLDIEKVYLEEREKKRKALKLTEAQFSQIDFVKTADRNLQYILKMPYVTQQNIDGLVEERLAELELPSEMVERLLRNPLREDEEASIMFMAQYRDKLNSLTDFYNELRVEEGDIQEETIIAMQKQGIQFQEAVDKGAVEARYVRLEEDAKISEFLHGNIRGYDDMLLQEPYMTGALLTYSLEETTAYLKNMERTLIAVEQDHNLFPLLRSYYLTLFSEIVKGSMYTEIFDENGVVKEEYQKIWKELAAGEDEVPTSFIMQPIVEEMEATDWRSSNSWDAFDHKEVGDMLVLAQNGMLTKK